MTTAATEATLLALIAERDPEFDPPPFDPAIAEAALGPSGAVGTPHRRLLELCNGAYLFGSALHLFGACASPPWHGLAAWNSPSLWRDAYGGLGDGLVLFAEDAFGDQYGYSGNGGEVVVFEAELGRARTVAPHFFAWVESVLASPSSLLPIDLVARERDAGRRIAPGMQLFAYPPLFSVESEEGVTIGVVDAVEAMRFRGDLARQIKDVPNGARVKIDFTD